MSIEIPTILSAVTHLGDQMPMVLKLVTAISYLLGIFMVFSAVYKFKQYGDLRTMMSSQTDLRGPMLLLTIGTMLLFFPSTYEMGLHTMFNYSSPLKYNGGGDGAVTRQTIVAIIRIMEVLGAIAVIRGLTLLARASGQGQPGMVGKGITHLVAGILAINVYGTWVVLENTLGFAVK